MWGQLVPRVSGSFGQVDVHRYHVDFPTMAPLSSGHTDAGWSASTNPELFLRRLTRQQVFAILGTKPVVVRPSRIARASMPASLPPELTKGGKVPSTRRRLAEA